MLLPRTCQTLDQLMSLRNCDDYVTCKGLSILPYKAWTKSCPARTAETDNGRGTRTRNTDNEHGERKRTRTETDKGS